MPLAKKSMRNGLTHWNLWQQENLHPMKWIDDEKWTKSKNSQDLMRFYLQKFLFHSMPYVRSLCLFLLAFSFPFIFYFAALVYTCAHVFALIRYCLFAFSFSCHRSCSNMKKIHCCCCCCVFWCARVRVYRCVLLTCVARWMYTLGDRMTSVGRCIVSLYMCAAAQRIQIDFSRNFHVRIGSCVMWRFDKVKQRHIKKKKTSISTTRRTPNANESIAQHIYVCVSRISMYSPYVRRRPAEILTFICICKCL